MSFPLTHNSREALLPGQIHLWFAFPEEIRTPALLAEYHKLMNGEEQAQLQRFHFEKHRHQYLITRALVRTTLSRYATLPPQEWRFSKNEYGRPEILPSAKFPPLRFNLSHADGLISCGVVLAQDIGVDVELTTRIDNLRELAEHSFSPNEVHDFSQLPLEDQRDRFFEYWTLKESYIKARGMGLSLPLTQFSFHLSADRPIGISFDPRLKDHPHDWHFWLLQPTSTHKATVAIRRNPHLDHSLIIRKVVPLMEAYPFDCKILKES